MIAKKLKEIKCGRGDLNSYGLPHQILSLARLPISPRPQYAVFCATIIRKFSARKRRQIYGFFWGIGNISLEETRIFPKTTRKSRSNVKKFLCWQVLVQALPYHNYFTISNCPNCQFGLLFPTKFSQEKCILRAVKYP